jgi:hypothetical protein
MQNHDDSHNSKSTRQIINKTNKLLVTIINDDFKDYLETIPDSYALFNCSTSGYKLEGLYKTPDLLVKSISNATLLETS